MDALSSRRDVDRLNRDRAPLLCVSPLGTIGEGPPPPSPAFSGSMPDPASRATIFMPEGVSVTAWIGGVEVRPSERLSPPGSVAGRAWPE